MAFIRGSSHHRNTRGFIVVAVLWILAALSALVLVYLTFVTNTAVVVTTGTDRVQTEALVTAAVELTAYQLVSVRDNRPSSGTFNARLGAGRVAVTFRSEAARIDLNAAPKVLLARLIAGLGATPASAETYADRILAWRSATEAGDDDPETSFYRTSGIAYPPRHAPFPQAEELWLVHGIPAQVIGRMLPFVTVYSNLASVNILDAAPQVVAALPDMTPERLQAVLTQRDDPRIDPRTLIGGGETASLTASPAYRLTVRTELANGRLVGTEVVILLLPDGDEPYRILSWRDGTDDGVAPPRAGSR